jgi:hypothetical protein
VILLPGWFILQGGQDLFKAAVKLPAWEQHPPPAGIADQADIRAQAHNCPLIAATGMFLPEPEAVIDLQVGEHCAHYNINPKPAIQGGQF